VRSPKQSGQSTLFNNVQQHVQDDLQDDLESIPLVPFHLKSADFAGALCPQNPHFLPLFAIGAGDAHATRKKEMLSLLIQVLQNRR
jgi:hypothetical protein